MSVIASPVPWSEVEQLIRAGIGARETARRLGLSEERVKRMCSRKGWLAPAQEPQRKLDAAKATLVQVTKEVCPHVPTASELLSEMNAKTKAAYSVAALKVAEKAALTDGDELLDRADSHQKWAGIASKVHGWDTQDRGGHQTVVNIGFLGPQTAFPALDGPVVIEDSGAQ